MPQLISIVCCVPIGQAHRRLWCVKGKKIASIHKPEKVNPDQVKPGNKVSMDHIISSQPGLITKM